MWRIVKHHDACLCVFRKALLANRVWVEIKTFRYVSNRASAQLHYERLNDVYCFSKPITHIDGEDACWSVFRRTFRRARARAKRKPRHVVSFGMFMLTHGDCKTIIIYPTCGACCIASKAHARPRQASKQHGSARRYLWVVNEVKMPSRSYRCKSPEELCALAHTDGTIPFKRNLSKTCTHILLAYRSLFGFELSALFVWWSAGAEAGTTGTTCCSYAVIVPCARSNPMGVSHTQRKHERNTNMFVRDDVMMVCPERLMGYG